MLQLENIKKDYKVVGANVTALDNISIRFRENEFVSILGQSGCGKTTLLNIVGGLDHYTSGDLIIKGISTKDFRDSDWDAYRNHTIGFIFQSYNLISHLNVLANVELALTISGVSASTRKERALNALKRVGLEEHIHKMPNQLSGGQMQRVAIARAIVNDPEILLADEPTGALDTVTSVQIMDLIKEIAEERLVIMVTHNPELAKKYSTRIVRLLDGRIVEDSNPCPIIKTTTNPLNTGSTADTDTDAETDASVNASVSTGFGATVYSTAVANAGADASLDTSVDANLDTSTGASASTGASLDTNAGASAGADLRTKKCKRCRKRRIQTPFKKTSMSFFTALALSFRNLLSKKGRTLLVSIASSIGIIGVTLVLALSNGFNLYISKLQADMLSTNPLTIASNQIDYSAILDLMKESDLEKFPNAKEIIVNNITEKLMKVRPSAEITDEYISSTIDTLDKSLYNGIVMSNGQKLNVYTYDIYKDHYKYINVNDSGSSQYLMMSSGTQWQFLLDNEEFIKTQYDVIGGTYPQNVQEVVLITDKYNQIGDNILKQLGVYKNGETTVNFDSIIGKTFYIATNDVYYTFDSASGVYKAGDKEITVADFDKSKYIELKISAILRPRSDTQNQVFPTGIAYSQGLQTLVQNSNIESQIVGFVNSNPTIDPFTNQTYAVSDELASVEKAQMATKRKLGGVLTPNYITIYPVDFASKNAIKSHLDAYNVGKTEIQKIHYGDVMGVFMESLTGMVDIISYVLIAFSSISLLVSSIMIAVITYVSVIERTKEIGALRSMGARKKDIARVFNAETFIIGLLAGIIGVGVTLLLTIPINIFIGNIVENIGSIAVLNAFAGLIMIGISIMLTLLAGFIPSRMASKKDPVTCLRTE